MFRAGHTACEVQGRTVADIQHAGAADSAAPDGQHVVAARGGDRAVVYDAVNVLYRACAIQRRIAADADLAGTDRRAVAELQFAAGDPARPSEPR